MEQFLAIILGIVGSFLQGNKLKEWITNEVWRARIRYLISLGISLLAGLMITFLSDQLRPKTELSWESFFANAGIAFAASQTFYNTYFKLK